jgi:hypothetical protein
VNENQEILFVNRGMVDNKLDIMKKIINTEDKAENYKHFYEKGHGLQ